MWTEGGFFELLASTVLSNRTWVFLPTKKQSQITDTGLWWRGIQHLLWGPARSRGSSCSKDLNSFMVSRGRFLKAMFGVKVTGFLTFFWLVSSEVTGLCFKNLNYQPSGSNHFIYYCGQESLRRNGVSIIVNKSPKCSTWMQFQKWQKDICLFPRQIIQYHGTLKSMPQPVMLKKLKLNGSMKT